jgi:hypothetical protein
MSTHTFNQVQDLDRVYSLYMELDARVREAQHELAIMEQLRDNVWQRIHGKISTPNGASKSVASSSSDMTATGKRLLPSKE